MKALTSTIAPPATSPPNYTKANPQPPLYSLASTGAITEAVQDELTRDFDHQSDQVQNGSPGSLARGLLPEPRKQKKLVLNWAESAAAIDRAEEEQARQDLMRRISTAGASTLGQVATITTVSNMSEHSTADNQPGQHHGNDEPDTFSWTDAAHWSPTGPDDELARDQLEALFSEIPDQEIGTVEHMGWFGLLKYEGRSGGVVFSQNPYGFRNVWETDSDEQLTQHWERLQREHNAFATATRARSSGSAEHSDDSSDHIHSDDRTEDNEREDATSGHYPEIWVGSLSDYNNGHLHGVWLDATLDPDELHHAVQFILRNGHDPTAEEWAIMDYDDFCGLSFGEYESLEIVSRIAQGIAEHGEAFAKWVGYVGERSEDLLTDEQFQDHYLGHFDSTKAYAERFMRKSP